MGKNNNSTVPLTTFSFPSPLRSMKNSKIRPRRRPGRRPVHRSRTPCRQPNRYILSILIVVGDNIYIYIYIGLRCWYCHDNVIVDGACEQGRRTKKKKKTVIVDGCVRTRNENEKDRNRIHQRVRTVCDQKKKKGNKKYKKKIETSVCKMRFVCVCVCVCDSLVIKIGIKLNQSVTVV